MPKKEETQGTDIAVRSVVGGLTEVAPSFMDADERMGMEDITKKIRPPFLKIIQKQSGNELLELFGNGAAVLVPDRTLILSGPDAAPVRFVPLCFYSEYLKLVPLKLKDQEGMFKERTFDHNSKLAAACRDPNKWKEMHPNFPNNPDYAYRNCEALNFLCAFKEDHIQLEMPFILSFSRGSYGKGQQFCNLIHMRKRPPFACVFELSVDPTPGKNSSGEWWRFRVDNPREGAWVTNEEEYNGYKALHLETKKRITEGILDTQYDAADLSDGDTGAAVNTGEYGSAAPAAV